MWWPDNCLHTARFVRDERQNEVYVQLAVILMTDGGDTSSIIRG